MVYNKVMWNNAIIDYHRKCVIDNNLFPITVSGKKGV